MAFEDQFQRAPGGRATDAAAGDEAAPATDGFTLVEGESIIETLPVQGADRFILTDRRVIYVGGDEEHRNWSFAPLAEVTSVEVARAPRERTTLVWGVLGLVAAVGIWQVATNDTVGIVGGVVMAALAALLLWDYYLRTPPSQLLFRADGKDIGGPLDRSAEAGARAFADAFFQLKSRQQAAPSRPAGTPRRYRYPGD